MPTVRKRAVPSGRGPIKILKVLGTPTPAAKTPKPAPAKPAPRAKVFSSLADALAQIAGVIKGVREREREGKIAAGVANKLALQLANFMEIAEELSAQEAAARLNAIQEEATKASRHQPAARVVSAVTASTAHGLRSALGLRNDPGADQALATRMTKQRAENAEQGHPGRPIDPLPEGAKPVIVDRPRPQTVEYGPGGERLQTTPAMAQVYVAITQMFVAADRRPITLSATELAGMTGLAVADVQSAIIELEKRRLLTRQPGRAFATPLWAPAAV